MLSRKKHKLFFRADGGPAIGMGHIMRCLALAEMLRAEYEIHFVSCNGESSLQTTIEEHGFGFFRLKEETSLPEELVFFKEISASAPCIIVLDGYHFTLEYEKALIEEGHKVLTIDDLHERPFYTDAVLNHAGGVDAKDYKTALFTRLCPGPGYSLVREVFRKVKESERVKETLLLAMGGADPDNITQHLLSLLQEIRFKGAVTVILGPAYRHQLRIPENSQFKVIRNASPAKLASLYRQTEVVLLPSSTMAYEACAARATIICGTLARNQQLLHQFLTGYGLALNAGQWHEIGPGQLQELLQQALTSSVRKEQKEAQEKLFDNHQKERIIKLFRKMQTEISLHIRKATEADCELYFHWAMDPETRRQAIHPEPIPWESHVKWFSEKLSRKDAFLYLLELENQPVGQVRFDAATDAPQTYIISYSMAPEARGKGLGEVVLQKALRQFQLEPEGPVTLKALVKEGNKASFRIFENLSFTLAGTTELKGESYWEFIKTGL